MGVTGIWLPLRVKIGWLLYSLLNGVITVTDDFCADTCILFESSQFSSWVKYCCRLSAALVMLGSEEVIVRSSAYDAIDTLGCRGVGRSWRKRLNNDGEITAPCGTPFFICLDLDLVSLYLT